MSGEAGRAGAWPRVGRAPRGQGCKAGEGRDHEHDAPALTVEQHCCGRLNGA